MHPFCVGTVRHVEQYVSLTDKLLWLIDISQDLHVLAHVISLVDWPVTSIQHYYTFAVWGVSGDRRYDRNNISNAKCGRFASRLRNQDLVYRHTSAYGTVSAARRATNSAAKMPSAPKDNSCNSTANKTPPPPTDDRTLEEKMVASKTYDEGMEHYWEDYEENPDYWESDEDYVGG